jgi:hypothetical protein
LQDFDEQIHRFADDWARSNRALAADRQVQEIEKELVKQRDVSPAPRPSSMRTATPTRSAARYSRTELNADAHARLAVRTAHPDA